MRLLDLMGQRYHTRPSEFVALQDAWLAYQFDFVVFWLGVKADKEQGESRSAKRGMLDDSDGTGKFRDPLPFVSNKINLNDYPDGLW